MLCNIDELLNELDISEEEKENLVQEVRNDFPDDEMLFELHLIRAVHNLQEKFLEKAKNSELMADNS